MVELATFQEIDMFVLELAVDAYIMMFLVNSRDINFESRIEFDKQEIEVKVCFRNAAAWQKCSGNALPVLPDQ